MAIGANDFTGSYLRSSRSSALITCEPWLPTSSVRPSGAARDTASVPITPPAPARSSTMMVAPSGCCISLASSRAIASTGPPAANGTTILTVSSARAAAAHASAAATSAIDPRRMKDLPGHFNVLLADPTPRIHQGVTPDGCDRSVREIRNKTVAYLRGLRYPMSNLEVAYERSHREGHRSQG